MKADARRALATKGARYGRGSSAALLAALLATLLGCTQGAQNAGDAGGSGMTPIDLSIAGPAPLPLITEFLARNQGGLTDEDGVASDWIEIHNPGAAPIALGGYHLTDRKSKPTRWTFPAETALPAGAYLVVFASGKDRAVAGKPLHTNFSLSSGDACSRRGAYLALTDKGGAPLPPEYDTYPAQPLATSYGLMEPSAAAPRAFFAEPTPGAANQAAAALPERVTFTPPSRTFNANTALSISLSVSSPDATIRYTTTRARPIEKPGRAGIFTADAATDIATLKDHGLASGDPVRVAGPTPLARTISYFVRVLDRDRFQLTVEPGGAAIDLTGSGSFEIRRDAATGTAATSDVITTSNPHSLLSGDAVTVTSAGALPGGLAPDATYYAVVASTTSLRLSPSPTLAPIVDITSTGAGALTIARRPSPVYTGPIPVTLSAQVRARAFEAGRPDGPVSSETYLALDAAAQAFSSNLPLVLTHTWNTVMGNDAPVDGQIMIFEPKAPDGRARLSNPPDLSSLCTLERHGSSTGLDPKFSMAVELQDDNGVDQRCSPLGMPAEADWLMHAPYFYDRAMMHNDLMYRTSNEMGRYAPRTRFVEHIHNERSLPDTIEGAVDGADYFGVYSFMEKISRDADRVDIEPLTLRDNDPPALHGGYVFKVDRLDSGESGIRPLPGQSFGNAGGDVLAWIYPKEVSRDPFKVVTPAQSAWVRAYIGEAYGVLAGPSSADPVNGYAKYWDVAAAIDHHILITASKNIDGFRHSAYWHKPRFGKITAGPLWDFDRALGSADGRDFDWGTWVGSGGNPFGGTDFFYYPWYKELFGDANFWQAWIDRYHLLRQGPLSSTAMAARIDELSAQLAPGGADAPAVRTATRWSVSAPRTSASNTPITRDLFDGSYAGEVAWLKHFWQQRQEFIESQFTRPAVANLAPGKVPTGSSVTLSSPSQGLAGVKIYYTTDGTDPRGRAPGPLLSPSAREYTGPIPITGQTTLFVRTFDPTPPSAPPAIGSSGVAAVPLGSGWSAPTRLAYSL